MKDDKYGPEFDVFAKNYRELHQNAIRLSGEDIGYFSKYKVEDTIKCILKNGFPHDLSILDFGSGIGESVPYFLKNLPLCRLTCLDVSQGSLNVGIKKFARKAQFAHYNGREIPFDDDFFHVIFTACVYHHIPFDLHKKLIEESYRVLRPGGIFIAFEHNPYNFITVKTVAACPFDDNAVLIHGKAFQRLLERGQFNNSKLQYRIFFPSSLRLLRPLEKFLSWLPLGAQYYVTAQKTV